MSELQMRAKSKEVNRASHVSDRLSSVASLPPVVEFMDKEKNRKRYEICSDTSTRTSLDSGEYSDGSESEQAPLSLSGPEKPAQHGRYLSQPNFRRARFCASPAPSPPVSVNTKVSVQEIHEAIVNVAPAAKVSHVHDGSALATPNLILIDSPANFSKGYGDAVPSFVLVDGCEQCSKLALDMIKSHASRVDAAVVVVLLEHPEMATFRPVVEKVSEFVDSGADDVIVIPVGVTKVDFLISVSFAKAQASRDQRNKLKKMIQASRKQCHRLFWEIAHEVVADFPEVQPQLHEHANRCVGSKTFVQKLGEGAFCTVHKWEDRAKNSNGAVKVFLKGQIPSAGHAMQIATEFATLKRLKHPNVVKFQGLAHGMHSVYLFMDMAGNTNLFQLLRAEGGKKGLPWSGAEGILAEIANGLAYCHKQKVAHCDLKPENIVISDSGCAKIVDFGQAVDLAEDVAPLQSPRGTMPFTAPEIMCLMPEWNPPAADVWSFGVIVVEMLCGIHSFMHLLDWQGKDLMSIPMLTRRAGDLKVFLAKDQTNAHANALAAVCALCDEAPPPFAIRMLGAMLEFEPEDRITAKAASECLAKEGTAIIL